MSEGLKSDWEKMLQRGIIPTSSLFVFNAADEEIKKLREDVRLLRIQCFGQQGHFLKQIDERIGYHRDSLNQWRDGTLTPTEPDEDEREKTIEGLKAAISALEVARGLFVGIYGGGE